MSEELLARIAAALERIAPPPPESADPLVLDFLEIPEAQYDPIRAAVYKEVAAMSKYMGL